MRYVGLSCFKATPKGPATMEAGEADADMIMIVVADLALRSLASARRAAGVSTRKRGVN